MKVKREITKLINMARDFGLPDKDLKSSKMLLDHYEFGLSLDTIITQIYEYDILVSQDFYDLVESLSIKLGFQFDDYACIKELIN